MSTASSAAATSSSTEPPHVEEACCTACNKPFGWFVWRKECGVCHKGFCSSCFTNAIVPEGGVGLNSIVEVCKTCFKSQSSLDHTRDFYYSGPADKPGAPTLLFVHGGGSCRNVFLPQTRALCADFHCYSIDLPGHGGLMDSPLTLASATNRVAQFVHDHLAGKRVIYIGHSMGGYLGMHIIGEHPDLFAGAIICGAGQNVGPSAGIAAKLGLMLISGATHVVSRKTLVEQTVKSLDSPHIPRELIDECCLRCGLFFDSSEGQIEILRAINPTAQLPKFPGPILFINGGLDHHDSQDLWLSASKHGSLWVYADGNHVFPCDKRFMDDFHQRIRNFTNEVFGIHTAATDPVSPAEPTPSPSTSTTTSSTPAATTESTSTSATNTTSTSATSPSTTAATDI
ncbi:hypothetical protein Pelo_8982 [Pelomyxa schiedti]|nr:hypothetical protein Pelo_8982 [Pelomyxa schiedti]